MLRGRGSARLTARLGLNSNGDAAAGAQTLDAYILSLSPVLYFKFNETSGNVINYGSLGSAGDGVISGTGVTQSANHLDFAGSTNTGVVTIPNNAAFNALQKFTYLYLVELDGAGGGGLGALHNMSTNHRLTAASTNRLTSAVARATGSFSVTTTNNATNYTPTDFIVFFNADIDIPQLSIDIGISGAVSNVGTNATGSGAINTQSAALLLGNSGASNQQMDGRYYRMAVIPSALTTQQKESVTTLAGV